MQHTMIAATFTTLLATTALADPAGYSAFSFDAPHHGRGVVGAIWYPTGGDGRAFLMADNAVFQGVEVVEEAPIADGTHPVVLLSHGMGGNIRSLAWLASALAEKGAIVLSVNHPNSTWGDFDMQAGLNHWTRTQDLSLALDVMSADPRFAGHFDDETVVAAGFSFGGWTALSMGGLRGNLDGYTAHCASYGDASSHCSDLMGAGIMLSDASDTDWDASYTDPRVTHVVAVDPGLIWGLSDDDFTDLIDNVRLVGLGDGDDRLLATDFDKSGLAAQIPRATIDRIAPATHFTALPLCKDMGATILIEENDDPVCTDPDGTDRKAVHDAIIAGFVADLGL